MLASFLGAKTMAKKSKQNCTAENQPMELGELKKIVDQFIDRFSAIDNEMDLLKEDQKNLIEEFKDRLDVKTLKQAIKTVKIAKKVDQLHTFESFVTILQERESI